jgi:hypothetical protein
LRPKLQSNEKANPVGEVEFRFRVRDWRGSMSGAGAQRLHASTLQPFQLLWRQ